MITEDKMLSFSESFNEMLEDYRTKETFDLDITTTERCNMKCSYCFESNKLYLDRKYDLDVMFKNIYKIVSHPLFLKDFKFLTITFWGGEPTIASDDIVEYIREFSKNPFVNFFFYTNGTLQKQLDTIIETFENCGTLDKCRLQISWDGDPIHDLRRGNSKLVRDQILRYSNLGVSVDTKATITPQDFSKFPLVWDSYCELNEYGDFTFAPTIDQSYFGNDYLYDFREAIAEICVREMDYFKKHGKTLLRWFGSTKKTCSYRKNMCCVDVSGNVYTCHGVLYENETIKKDETLGNISDDMWVDTYFLNRSVDDGDISDVCKGCDATYCCSCCIKNASLSDKATPKERWFDCIQTDRCEYYKVFGAYDKALHRKIARM